jgi:hypothetical protein
VHSTPVLGYIRGMRTWLFALAALAACDSPSKLDAVSAGGVGGGIGDCDPLWDLAPAGTEVGIVASPRGLALALDAFTTAAQLVATPDFTGLAPELDVVTAALFGAPGATPTDAGIEAAPGFALFVTPGGVIAVMPVVDRDKFVASKHGTRAGSGSSDDVDDIRGSTCKVITGHYACASSPALFAQLGTGSLRGKAELAGGRGDIEVYATQLPLFGGSPGALAVTAQLSRGELAVRGVWTGMPGGGLGKLIGIKAPRVDATNASGFAAGNVSAILANLPPVPLAGGVTADQLAQSFAGSISAVIPSGSLDLQVHVPLTDPAPATTALDHCKDLGQMLDLVADQPKHACRFRIQAAAALELEAWVDAAAKELRLGAHRDAPAPGAPGMLTPIGRELATGDWTAAFWGRGSTLAAIELAPTIVPPPPDAATAIHAIAMINELGGGVRIDAKGITFRGEMRTIWTNPPELAQRLAEISGADITSGIAIATATVDAATAPGTPFARDFAAGQGGLIIPTGVLGLATAVVIPALEGLLLGGEAGEGGEPGDDAPQLPGGP